MKALVLAVALAALSSSALAGATREAHPKAAVDKTATSVMADASRLGSASLTSLNGSPWAPQNLPAESDFDSPSPEVDAGTVFIVLGVLVVALARPVSRALRRQEQHRRATALASTLGHAPRH
ncbi:hypothetical protein [Roseateles sp.]|uniref:hypothetical protein n=1 Tax=Roseateles sp. TaxID=1971397 RepID=UPI0025F5E160|nr:hypothetical protein [Roseateles sp.]MBV8036009.1 hypothetical protein [Roseateles sp.]